MIALPYPLTGLDYDGPLPAWLLITLGVAFLLGGVLALLGPHGPANHGMANGTVVEVDRPGKRPTVIEFVAANGTSTRFKHGGRLAPGTTVVVQYSVADPRNAKVDRRSASARRGVGNRVAGGIAVALGVLLIVRGVLDAAG